MYMMNLLRGQNQFVRELEIKLLKGIVFLDLKYCWDRKPV